jgi:isopropylmalate/homocitrate/citramalate synthase
LHITALAGFEAINPERIGLHREILYGIGSDKRVVEMLAKKNNYKLTPEQIDLFVLKLKKLGNKGIILQEKQAKKVLDKTFSANNLF